MHGDSVLGRWELVFGLWDQSVHRVEHRQAVVVLPDHAFDDEARAGFDSCDALATDEDEGDRPGAVGDSDFEALDG